MPHNLLPRRALPRRALPTSGGRLMRLALVAGGGALGAVARYVLTDLTHRLLGAHFPWGTAAVNLLGCFAIGALSAGLEGHWVADSPWRLTLVVGVLGGFTTFSAFGYETVALLRLGGGVPALANIGLNVGAGLGAVIAGRWLVQTLGL